MLISASLLLAACGESSSQSAFVRQTFLQVNPERFPVPPSCEPEGLGSAGAYASYVATVVEVSCAADGGTCEPRGADGGQSTVGNVSSPLVACRSAVRFSDEVAPLEHQYMVWIDAYAAAAADLTVDPRRPRQVSKSGAVVAPLYQFACSALGVAGVEQVQLTFPATSPAAADAGFAGDAGLDAAMAPAPDAGGETAPLPGEMTRPISPVSGQTVVFRGCVPARQLP